MDGNVFGQGRPIVTVVQSAQAIMGKHLSRGPLYMWPMMFVSKIGVKYAGDVIALQLQDVHTSP